MKINFDPSEAKPWSDKDYQQFHEEHDDDLRLIAARFWARACHISYRETQNPLFAWSAFSKLRATREDIPNWILDYFAECAAEIDGIRKASPQKVDAAVSKALGFTSPGRGTAFSDFEQFWRDLTIALKVHKHVLTGLAPDYACDFVQDETGNARSMVWRAYNKFKDIFIQ